MSSLMVFPALNIYKFSCEKLELGQNARLDNNHLHAIAFYLVKALTGFVQISHVSFDTKIRQPSIN